MLFRYLAVTQTVSLAVATSPTCSVKRQAQQAQEGLSKYEVDSDWGMTSRHKVVSIKDTTEDSPGSDYHPDKDAMTTNFSMPKHTHNACAHVADSSPEAAAHFA